MDKCKCKIDSGLQSLTWKSFLTSSCLPNSPTAEKQYMLHITRRLYNQCLHILVFKKPDLRYTSRLFGPAWVDHIVVNKASLSFFDSSEGDSDVHSYSLILPVFMKCNISSSPTSFFQGSGFTKWNYGIGKTLKWWVTVQALVQGDVSSEK